MPTLSFGVNLDDGSLSLTVYDPQTQLTTTTVSCLCTESIIQISLYSSL